MNLPTFPFSPLAFSICTGSFAAQQSRTYSLFPAPQIDTKEQIGSVLPLVKTIFPLPKGAFPLPTKCPQPIGTRSRSSGFTSFIRENLHALHRHRQPDPRLPLQHRRNARNLQRPLLGAEVARHRSGPRRRAGRTRDHSAGKGRHHRQARRRRSPRHSVDRRILQVVHHDRSAPQGLQGRAPRQRGRIRPLGRHEPGHRRHGPRSSAA